MSTNPNNGLTTVMGKLNNYTHPIQLQLEKDFMKDEEIHMHFPAGAISKDGPSAGVTILTVLVSLLANRCVRSDVAMTGEITLNGVVLPVSQCSFSGVSTHAIPSFHILMLQLIVLRI